MRFLFDVCSSAHVMKIPFEEQSQDVLHSSEVIEASAADAQVLALSVDLGRVLDTADKDFMKLVVTNLATNSLRYIN